MNVKLGDEVGYSIRFEDVTSTKTKVKFVTDGVLLRECISDPLLSQYDIIILDEAHERSLQTDILMGLLKQLQFKRPTIRLVVMSATLQVDLYQSFFDETNVIYIAGRQYPVDVFYTEDAVDDFIDAALLTCLQIHAKEEDGGVLVFLPGQDDIESLSALLETHLPSVIADTKRDTVISNSAPPSKKLKLAGNTEAAQRSEGDGQTTVVVKANFSDFKVYALYAALSPDDQMAVFAPSTPGIRKFILSTNIAETSVTLSGVKFVVDTGFAKCRMLQESTGIEMLKVRGISKAQANQRAGRSGRESPGKCFRLYTEDMFESLEEVPIPEIQRVNIAQVILQLKAVGVESPLDFPYLSPPSRSSLRGALETLLMLRALDRDMSLTTHGRSMVRLPLEPHYAHLLLKSVEHKCVSEVLTIVSLLSR